MFVDSRAQCIDVDVVIAIVAFDSFDSIIIVIVEFPFFRAIVSGSRMWIYPHIRIYTRECVCVMWEAEINAHQFYVN